MNPAEPEQPELWEELRVDGTWFHLVRSMILGGKIAEMGADAWAVYCTIKAYTQMQTGDAFPTRGTIAGHIGCSHDTVDRSIKRLVKMGLVRKGKAGRQNLYELIEQVPMRNAGGEITHVSEAKYVPTEFAGFIQALQEFAKSGQNNNVHITINTQVIHQGDNSVVNIQNIGVGVEEGRAPSSKQKPPQEVYDLKEKLTRSLPARLGTTFGVVPQKRD